MNDFDLRVATRVQEQLRRQERRDLIFRMVKNMADQDKEAVENLVESAAWTRVRKQQEAFNFNLVPKFGTRDYWKRLWCALLAKGE